VHYLKPKLAKLPLPPEDTARARRHREMLDDALVMIHDAMKRTHEELVEEAEDRKAARAAAAAQREAATPSPPKPARTQKPEPQPANPETPPRQPRATPDPALRPHRGTRPQQLLFQLARALQFCIRLDGWLADRINGAHTTAELAGLHHPNRAPILDYLHKATRFEEPFQFQRTTHDSLETRISEELAWAPNRNPADIIIEICTHYNLPYDINDFPNNWRPTPPQDPPPFPRPIPDYADPEEQEYIVNTVLQEMENRRLRGLDE
jgi:hypothetical protein